MIEDDDKVSEKDLKDLGEHWNLEIELALKNQEDFRDRCKEAYKAYFGDNLKREGDFDRNPSRHLNIFWANVETLKPSIFSRIPQPEVSRRERTKDPLAIEAARAIEDSTKYCLEECQDFKGIVSLAVQDYLVVGRGVLWDRYDVKRSKSIEEFEVRQAEQGFVYPDGQPVSEEFEVLQREDGSLYHVQEVEGIEYEKAITDYIHYKDYLHNTARTESEIRWKAKRVYMTKAELEKAFGAKLAKEIKRETISKELKEARPDEHDQKKYSKAQVWEIWDKVSKKVIWVSPGLKEKALKVQDDFLGLDGFFPCSVITSNTTTDSVLPKADYFFIKDQLLEIDRLTERIHAHVEALRMNGAAPKEFANVLEQLFDDDLKIHAIKDWSALAAKGGIEQSIFFLPVDKIAANLQTLYNAREAAISKVDQVMAISDIIRGQSDARESATASMLKNAANEQRYSDRRMNVQLWIAKQVKIKAEIICEHFEPETIISMAPGVFSALEPEQIQQVLELMSNDAQRRYRIDIEVDSTVIQDDKLEQERRSEFLGAIGQFLGQSLPMMQQYSELAPVLLDFVGFAARGYKAGRELEAKIEEGLERFREQQAQQAQDPQQQQDPAQMEAQSRMQIEQMRLQGEQMKHQNEMQLESAKAQHEMSMAQFEAQIEAAKLEIERAKLSNEQLRIQMEAQKLGVDLQVQDMKASTDIFKAEKNLQKEAMDTEQEAIKAAAQSLQPNSL